MQIRHVFTAALVIGSTTVGLAAPRQAQAGTVTVKGSDTMVVLGQRWAEEFMKKNPKTTIQVTGGGSGTGHQRAHQRHDRHLRGVALDEGRREEAARREGRRAADRDPGRARTACPST